MAKLALLIPPKPDPDLIDHAEKLLMKVKSGDIVAMAEIAIRRGNNPTNGWCVSNWRHRDIMLAELGRLKTVLTLADTGFRREVAEMLEQEMDRNG